MHNVVVIAGPTASGKSFLGATLANRAGGVVINADSLQLYDALPILTARPGPDLTALAPHKLYGVLPPTRRSTAAGWAQQALIAIDKAQAAGQVPILVGGTGLYLEALMHGMAPIPPVPEGVRQQAAQDLQQMGRAAFHARLIAADPAAQRLALGDTQRLLRAWEVYSATGKTLTGWQQIPAEKPGDLAFRTWLILPPRAVLRDACDRRFLAMMDSGAEAEVQAFLTRYDASVPATQALGFAPLAQYLSGTISRKEAIAQAQAQTRQYAKRQTTWFNNRFKKTTLLEGIFDSVSLETVEICLSRLRNFKHN